MTELLKDKLPKMLSLAHERTEDSRVHLAGMLADLFLDHTQTLSLREEELINELIDQLLMNSSSAVRMRLVEKFVDMSRMPNRIATNLARDTIDVARNVLVANGNLRDEDLIQVIDLKGSDHALAIAARREISEAVADALVTTGDVRVMQAVAENLGAHLTPRAIDSVVDAARYAAKLREPILRRPEIGATAAIRLYWWVEQDLRRYALKRFGISAGQIEQALSDTIETFLKDHAHDRANDEVMAQVCDWMDTHQAITLQVLPQVLRLGHFRLFNMLLSRLTKLDLPLVDKIVSEAGGRGLSALCRALGMEKPAFVSLFLLSRGAKTGDQVVHPRELAQALATFDRLSTTIAKDMLHSWSVNPEFFTRSVLEAANESRAS